jgi:hypothetical protein
LGLSVHLNVYPSITYFAEPFNVGYEITVPETLARQCNTASLDLNFSVADIKFTFLNPKYQQLLEGRGYFGLCLPKLE